jgi:hypothetical protein
VNTCGGGSIILRLFGLQSIPHHMARGSSVEMGCISTCSHMDNGQSLVGVERGCVVQAARYHM